MRSWPKGPADRAKKPKFTKLEGGGEFGLNLILDFDMIEQGTAAGAPKYMEWYGAFGLMVTIVWLYLEILRLLSKLAGRK